MGVRTYTLSIHHTSATHVLLDNPLNPFPARNMLGKPVEFLISSLEVGILYSGAKKVVGIRFNLRLSCVRGR